MVIDLNPPVRATAVEEDVDSAAGAEPFEDEGAPPTAEAPGTKPDAPTVFPQSVASGDPTAEGAILWTRVAPEAHEPERPLYVTVAENEALTENRQSLQVLGRRLSSDSDYTVKIDLDESELVLDPDSTYYYQFTYGGVGSPLGRFRTLPGPDSSPESVRFAIATCQNYLYGRFGAYRHIADEDVDFLLDLGDFIYEYATRREGSRDYPGREICLPSGGETASCLKDYRHLYRTYHEEPPLQRALERHARIFTWDDHEFANDVYWDADRETLRAPESPVEDRTDEDPEASRELFGAALKAWWEYTPTRANYDEDDPEDDVPLNERINIYRSFEFGDLLTLVVTDERLFKSKPEDHCAETRFPDRLTDALPEWIPFCYVNKDPDVTMLGETQREWFEETLSPDPVWTAWANEVLTLPARVGVGPFSVDPSDEAWDGYEAEREELMHQVKDEGVRNFVTLTGDMHSYLAGYQRLEYPSAFQDWLTEPDYETEQSRRVGVELMTPAVTSINAAEKFGERFANREVGKAVRRWSPWTFELLRSAYGRGLEGLFSALIRRMMPHIEAFNSHDWGYSVVEFTRDECRHTAYSVDKKAPPSEAERTRINTVHVPEGEIEILQAD